jgi:hypothetical protein
LRLVSGAVGCGRPPARRALVSLRRAAVCANAVLQLRLRRLGARARVWCVRARVHACVVCVHPVGAWRANDHPGNLGSGRHVHAPREQRLQGKAPRPKARSGFDCPPSHPRVVFGTRRACCAAGNPRAAPGGGHMAETDSGGLGFRAQKAPHRTSGAQRPGGADPSVPGRMSRGEAAGASRFAKRGSQDSPRRPVRLRARVSKTRRAIVGGRP